ncbi:MAG: hypothetical protein E5X80_04970 [Mesorhizobium sp.]|uniref:hypothetical protein n=1 Tax=Mesorhizobium sp. TaxID=1871066 RepID=UPI0011FFE961|nr:hypothetical protein [Mesorhizobium sp.]TIO52982.1 MAG: hypothetical protein E5X78_10075 [Mesorhizobium sp.]TIO61815.1 MAG: hypothetical protein E5X79_05455 [Mesorhizobium sp.]TJV66730.1 MAG: hypothetical protein E5X80_04970 [Mesorhizobium sp.]
MSGVTPFFEAEENPSVISQITSASSILLLGLAAAGAATGPAAATSLHEPTRIIHLSGLTTSEHGTLTDLLRRAAFVNVHNTIDAMACIPAGEDYYVDGAAAEDARFALSLLYITGIPVPKVFSHDSESVTFSWARGSDRQYITVSEGVASLLRTSSTTSEVLEHSSLHDPSIVGLLKMAGEYGGGTEFVRQQ